MPDPNTNSDLVPTSEEAAALEKFKEQFQAELDKARHLDLPVTMLEIQHDSNGQEILVSVPQGNSAPPFEPGNGEIPAPTEETTDTTNILEIIQVGMDAVQEAAATLVKLSQLQLNANQAASGATNSTPANIPAAPNPSSPNGGETNGPMSPGPAGATSNAPPAALTFPGTSVAPAAGGANAASSSADGEAFSRAVAAQTQSFQTSSERLSAALEQNTFTASSLFSRMLELMDAQNRNLADVNRKISELSSQIKSLKNP